MNNKKDNISMYEQQEERIRIQSDAFISLLTQRGILGDHKIDDEKIRNAHKAKQKNTYHNTLMLLKNYRTIAWRLECFPDSVAEGMEDYRDDLVVIVAGYVDEMRKFIAMNPGLRSRFNKYINFENYSANEMLEIFKLSCEKNRFLLWFSFN